MRTWFSTFLRLKIDTKCNNDMKKAESLMQARISIRQPQDEKKKEKKKSDLVMVDLKGELIIQ